jgi:bacterioferritin-associated ferredoxin
VVVCVCNAIRERQVREAARGGAMDPCGAYASLGCRPKCGKCLPFARDLIAAERALA